MSSVCGVAGYWNMGIISSSNLLSRSLQYNLGNGGDGDGVLYIFPNIPSIHCIDNVRTYIARAVI